MIQNATVVVDGNRIVAVGPSGRVSIPGRALHRRSRQVHHACIIDAHAHIGTGRAGIAPKNNWGSWRISPLEDDDA